MGTCVLAGNMGPEGGYPPIDVLSPPYLSASSDHFIWRTKVALWSRLVRRISIGGDKNATGILSAMGLTLYQATDGCFTAERDAGIMTGNLRLGEGNTAEAIQLQNFESIFQVVPKDSATDYVSRGMMMMQQVQACKLQPKEKLSILPLRVQGWGYSYINYIGDSNPPPSHQGLTMLILQNTNLSYAVCSAILTHLVARATSTRSNNSSNMI